MTDLGEYDPALDRDYGPPKEEPDCPPCCDSGRAAARWWSRRPYRECPACGRPDWLDRLTYRLYRARRWLTDRTRPGEYDDEAPF